MPAAISVIDRPEQAGVLLKPEHQNILQLLSTPDSAAGLARQLGWSRQIVNYHLKDLESAGLIALKEERKRGNCLERVMERTATSYVINPDALGTLGADPALVADKLSASYLVAISARTIKEISKLTRAAAQAGKSLPTLSIDTEVRFRNAADRSAFTAELTAALAALVRKYHDEKSPGGRRFRVTAGAYPHLPQVQQAKEIK